MNNNLGKSITKPEDFKETQLYQLERKDKSNKFNSDENENIFICLKSGIIKKTLSNFHKMNDINITNSHLFEQFTIHEVKNEEYRQKLLNENYKNTQDILNRIKMAIH